MLHLDVMDRAAFAFLMDLYGHGRVRFDELDGWLRLHVVLVGVTVASGLWSGRRVAAGRPAQEFPRLPACG